MVGMAGPVIIFMCLLVLQAIVGFLLFSYASRGFLLVVEETAAGNDEVVWAREPITDWFGKLFYLGWIAGVWLVPTWLVLRWVHLPLLGDEPGLQFVVVSVAVVWLLFPVSLLSSLAAGTPWGVLYPGLLGRLVRHPGAVFGLYISSALLLAGSVGIFYLVMAKAWGLLLLPVAAMTAAAVFLIYARLLGRVARIVNRHSAEEVTESDEPASRPARSATSAQVVDPWAVPKEKRRKPPKKRGTYGIKDYEPAPEAPSDLPAGEIYGVQPPAPIARPSLPVFAEEEKARDKTRLPPRPTPEAELERREEPPPLPAHPLFEGVYSFPWYRTTLGAWALLSFGLLFMGLVLRAQIAVWPGGGESDAARAKLSRRSVRLFCTSPSHPGGDRPFTLRGCPPCLATRKEKVAWISLSNRPVVTFCNSSAAWPSLSRWEAPS